MPKKLPKIRKAKLVKAFAAQLAVLASDEDGAAAKVRAKVKAMTPVEREQLWSAAFMLRCIVDRVSESQDWSRQGARLMPH